MRVATFSLVAQDPKTGDLGVAVASKFLAVGAVVPFAEAGVGAIATQSYANPATGPRASPSSARGEPGRGPRGLPPHRPRAGEAPVRPGGGHGESLTFTGAECHPWAGGGG